MSAANFRLWLPVDEVRRLIAYDPLTGIFTAKTASHKGRWLAGRECGHLDIHGYKIIKIKGMLFRGCRIAFVIMEGRWPEEVDHIDGTRSDVWANLRECSHLQNSANQKLRTTNKTGRTGVYQTPNGERWFAEISSNYKRKRIGTFDTFDEAVAARAKYEREWHGEFSRWSK